MEKILRVYDLERPDADPQMLTGAAKGIRDLLWVANDGPPPPPPPRPPPPPPAPPGGGGRGGGGGAGGGGGRGG